MLLESLKGYHCNVLSNPSCKCLFCLSSMITSTENMHIYESWFSYVIIIIIIIITIIIIIVVIIVIVIIITFIIDIDIYCFVRRLTTRITKCRYKQKFSYSIVGHSGDGAEIPLVSYSNSPNTPKDVLKVLQKMSTHSEYAASGDSTLDASTLVCPLSCVDDCAVVMMQFVV